MVNKQSEKSSGTLEEKKSIENTVDSIKNFQKESLGNIGSIFIVPKTGSVQKTLCISTEDAVEYAEYFGTDTLEKGDSLFMVPTDEGMKYFPYKEEFFCLQ